MEYREWLKQLKAGDDVVVHARDWSGSSYCMEKVEKITPTGLIRVDGILYRPQDGYSRSRGSGILDPSDEDVENRLKAYNQKSIIRETIYKMRNINYEKVTYEQAVEISKIMGWTNEN